MDPLLQCIYPDCRRNNSISNENFCLAYSRRCHCPLSVDVGLSSEAEKGNNFAKSSTKYLEPEMKFYSKTLENLYFHRFFPSF